MQYTIPDYYREFTCIAGECPDTCCAGWQIMIDDKSLKKYRKVKGPFRNPLHNGIDWKERAFLQNDRRCEFLNEGNLCDIYSEAGKHMLCDTCRKYPRHVEEFEGLKEISLSLSCPETARILLEKKEEVRFLHGEKTGREEEYEEFDYLLFSALMDAWDYLIEILQNREVTMKVRMGKALAYAHDFQVSLDKGELYREDEIRQHHRKSGFGSSFLAKWENWTKDVESNHTLFQRMWKIIVPEMEVLRGEWTGFLKENLQSLYQQGAEGAEEMRKEFELSYDSWEIQCEQLMVYWVFSYFCGAVYDGAVFTKMKLAVISTLFIRELDAGRFLTNNRKFGIEDQILICHWYSRELEHSDQNLIRLEEILEKDPIFGFREMLSII